MLKFQCWSFSFLVAAKPRFNILVAIEMQMMKAHQMHKVELKCMRHSLFFIMTFEFISEKENQLIFIFHHFASINFHHHSALLFTA